MHSANCQPFLRSQPLNKPCKYARLRARGSERANNSAISPCARNNSRFHPARRFSITHARRITPQSGFRVAHLSTTVVLEQTSNAEEELAVSGVAVGVRSLHRAEDSVDNDAQCTVGGEARSLVEGIRRLAV